MWATSVGHGEIGKDLALSPMQGQVAFLSELVSVQMPSALLHVGLLEIWDVAKKTGSKPGIKALDDRLAWFPDGKRLAYAKLVKPNAPAGSIPVADAFGKTFRDWEKVPAVFVWDLAAGTESFLHVGWRPVVSHDGRSVLVSDLESTYKQVDVATGKASTVTWRGIVWPGAIASPAKDVVLSWCYPTQGLKIKYTTNNSPLRGPKQMLTLKLARLNSAEFQTVVPYLDPRWKVSFGEVQNNLKE
jgi:hypothetical protein